MANDDQVDKCQKLAAFLRSGQTEWLTAIGPLIRVIVDTNARPQKQHGRKGARRRQPTVFRPIPPYDCLHHPHRPATDPRSTTNGYSHVASGLRFRGLSEEASRGIDAVSPYKRCVRGARALGLKRIRRSCRLKRRPKENEFSFFSSKRF